MEPYYERAGITIYHGDCREILPTLEAVGLVIADPPYGINLQKHRTGGLQWFVAGDQSGDVGQWFIDYAQARRWPLIAFASPMQPWSGSWRQYLVWDKGPAVGGGGDPGYCWKATWELIQVANTPRLNGSRDSAVLQDWITPAAYEHHPCQKPERLVRYLIDKASASSGTILDPFMGSGTTLRAAMDLGRRAIGIEIEERYCEIAAKRLQQAVLPIAV